MPFNATDDNQDYQLKYFSLPTYRLTLYGNLENIEEYFSNSKANISYLPIKLTINCSNLSILDLIRIQKKLPHVTFLSVDLKSILEIEDQRNENTNAQNRFNNMNRLEINVKMPWKMVIYLIQYFPKLMDLHVYCEFEVHILDAICDSFPFKERADIEHLR